MPNAGLDDLDSHSFPVGWQFSPGSSTATATSIAGYESPRLLTLTNSSDQTTQSSTLTSPLVSVQSTNTYFYKGYYKSTIPFDLLIRTDDKDGTSTQRIIGRYDNTSAWSTVSYAFQPATTTTSVQFIYSFAKKGELQIDNNYLEPNPTDVIMPEAEKTRDNLISNASLASSDGQSPDQWNTFHSGTNTATFSYETTTGEPYVQTNVADYKDGEAKWQYDPIRVQPGDALRFDITYKSTAKADVVAEYTLSTGERRFHTLTTLIPAKDWTVYSGTVEAMPDAQSIVITAILHTDGSLATKHSRLTNTTKPGTVTWYKSAVSITFDDGWESTYVNGTPILDNYGYKGTFYLNPSSLDTPDFMTSDQVAALQKNGHQLASHGYQHLDFTTVNTETLNDQLQHSLQYFRQVHSQSTVDFATPFGGSDPQVAYYTKKYYASLRTTNSGINTRQNFDPYNLSVLYIGDDTPLDFVTRSLDEAKARNGWLILVYHRIDPNTVGKPSLPPSQFEQHMAAIKKSSIEVKTVASAREQFSAEP
jgi:peptidoglycan/xylan/chitin deacetylase (PgdA/CDA1 family)